MELTDIIPVINDERNYWLVRTQGGEFFQEFYLTNFIAIGWNAFNDIDLIKNIQRHEELVENIAEKYPNDKKPGLSANQMRKFTKEMKKGDIVIIPSENSNFIAYGELLEDEIYIEEINENKIEEGFCDYQKRRKVKWINHQSKENLDIYMYRLLNNHQTIANANDYSTIIDRTLFPLYIKNGEAHFTLRVNQENNIRIKELSQLINNHMNIIKCFNSESNENLSVDDIDIKINVQSPGPVEIHGAIYAVAIIGFVTIAVCGGSFKFTHKNSIEEVSTQAELKSDGFIEKIIKFMDHWTHNKAEIMTLKEELKTTKEKLKISVPDITEVTLIEAEDKEK